MASLLHLFDCGQCGEVFPCNPHHDKPTPLSLAPQTVCGHRSTREGECCRGTEAQWCIWRNII
jgi:hypothetical protein